MFKARDNQMNCRIPEYEDIVDEYRNLQVLNRLEHNPALHQNQNQNNDQ